MLIVTLDSLSPLFPGMQPVHMQGWGKDELVRGGPCWKG